MTDVTPAASYLSRLAVPGERLGWIFRDRNLYRRRFLEPPPVPGTLSPALVLRAQLNQARLPRRILLSLGVGGGLACGLYTCGAAISGNGTSGWPLMVTAVLIAGVAIAGVLASMAANRRARTALLREQYFLHLEHEEALADWHARRVEFDRQQQEAVDQMLEWGAATPSPGTRRIDIVGGTTWGWEAVLTVFGGSLLSTKGAITLVDFTGEALCGELLRLAEQTRHTVGVIGFPSQLDQLDLLSGLGSQELIDSLVEAMHGDQQGSSRAERSQDTMLLTDLCSVLGDHVTLARIVAGLRVLTDRPGEPALDAEESRRVLDLLPDEARRQAHGHLRRLEGLLHPLEAIGSAPPPAPAAVSCLIADREGRSARSELLKDLIVQWLIRRLSQQRVDVGSIIVLGADEVHHRHVERLARLCERPGVRLVLFFEHLREHSLQSLGGGDVCFMRLGNHQQAQRAAEFIGRQHTFVLSQLTRTLGGHETHTVADTEGFSETTGYSESSGRSFGVSHFPHPGSHRGVHSSRTSNWSTTRNWSKTLSTAIGMNWSDATAAHRVYEFAVEPRVLQDLPDHALLLVKREEEGHGSVVQAVECDPAIVTLPRMTMQPLVRAPLPAPEDAVFPVSGPPEQVTLSNPARISSEPALPGEPGSGILPDWGPTQHTSQYPWDPQ